MMPPELPRGIVGFGGREPIGAALSVGIKGPNGAPVKTNRFFIVRPVADGQIRAPHPAFARFNETSPRANEDQKVHDEARAHVRGILVHSREVDCFTYRLQGQVIKGAEHPRKAPSCMGDGARALRWSPQADDYLSIPCPNTTCPYRSSVNGKRPECGPHAKLLFQLRFESFPSMLCKFTSNGNETTDAILGFFRTLTGQARQLGIMGEVSVYGVPFELTISRKSNAKAGTKWPVVHMSTDFPPGLTLQDYLLRQAEARRQLTGASTLLLGTAVAVGDDATDDALADDAMSLRPGCIPAIAS